MVFGTLLSIIPHIASDGSWSLMIQMVRDERGRSFQGWLRVFRHIGSVLSDRI